MFDKVKQMKELRDQAQTMKKALAEHSVTGEGAKGKVTIVMDGNQDVLTVDIDPELLTPERKEDVQKAIKEALADAIRKVQQIMAKQMQSLSGFNMPGM